MNDEDPLTMVNVCFCNEADSHYYLTVPRNAYSDIWFSLCNNVLMTEAKTVIPMTMMMLTMMMLMMKKMKMMMIMMMITRLQEWQCLMLIVFWYLVILRAAAFSVPVSLMDAGSTHPLSWTNDARLPSLASVSRRCFSTSRIICRNCLHSRRASLCASPRRLSTCTCRCNGLLPWTVVLKKFGRGSTDIRR